ncbi:MAG: universal stress protein [Solirubrobacteraceae bacterium]
MFRKVIVGFDGSERGLDALMLGQTLTAPEGDLIVCCVHHLQPLSARIDPTEPTIDHTSAQESIERATRMLKGGLTVTPMFLAGENAAKTLQGAAISEQADLVVLGSSHRGALGRVLLGSVTQATLREAPCPVAVAPVGFHDHSESNRLARIAVGHDTVEPTPDALTAAVGLCEETGTELRLVAVAEDAAVPDPARATMPYTEITQARLRAAEQSVADALSVVPETVSATSEVRDGDPAEELLEVSRDADLLLLGSHGRGTIGRLIMGSVCDRVVRAAACPVLVVPPAEITDTRGSARLAPAIASADES